MHRRTLTLGVFSCLFSALLLAAAVRAEPATVASAESAESLRAAPAAEQKPPEELVSPAPSPRQAFRDGLTALHSALHSELDDLQRAAKATADPQARAAVEAARVRAKQNYERELVKLQCDLARAEGDQERLVELEDLQQRLVERHARAEEVQR